LATLTKRYTLGAGNAPVTGETVLLDQNFDDWNLGSPSATYWNARMGSGGNSGDLARHEVVTNPAGGRMMRVTLLADTDGAASGTGMEVAINSPTTKVYIEYSIRFTSTVTGGTFDLGGGGKIPGVGYRGAINPTGGNYVGDTGFSLRGMWVTPVTYGSRANGEGLLYYYGKDQSDIVDPAYGDNLWWGSGNVFVPNTWYDIKMAHELNTVGQANANHYVWRNGAAISNANFLNRETRGGEYTFNRLYWHIFLGGDGSAWWVDENQWVDINNIRIVSYT
jgi:hypothetical protein